MSMIELTPERLLARVELLLQELVERDPVRVEAIDTTPIIASLAALGHPPNAEEIAAAIARTLQIPAPVDPRPELKEVTEQIKRLFTRMEGIRGGGGGPSEIRVRNVAGDPVPTREFPADRTANVTSVDSSDSTVTLLEANTSRAGAYVFNDSTAALYLKYGAGASTSSFTVKLAASGYFEFPTPCYCMEVTGVWASVNGAARVTEVTT